jgi:hypothetical protein
LKAGAGRGQRKQEAGGTRRAGGRTSKDGSESYKRRERRADGQGPSSGHTAGTTRQAQRAQRAHSMHSAHPGSL